MNAKQKRWNDVRSQFEGLKPTMSREEFERHYLGVWKCDSDHVALDKYGNPAKPQRDNTGRKHGN